MNLRARLTLWYTSVLAVVLLVFGALVYLILWFSLTQQIDQLLEDRANDILRASQGSVRNVGVVVSLPPLEVFSTPNVYVQVWDNQGRLSASSANLGQYAQPLDPARLSVVRSTGAHDVTIQRTHLRVITHPIQVGAQIFGWLQIGASLEAVDRARDYLLLLLTGGILIAVAVSALLGWNTTSQALRPIHAVTEAALQITRADDLSRRIPQIGPPTDEVGRLVAAFNDTLERLEALFNTQRRFLADISHELRTPLTAIRGNVDLMRRMGSADPTSLDAIQSEAERMTRMVGDLLLLAQAESGNLPLAKVSVELDTVMLEVYQQARVLAGGKVDVTISDVDQLIVLGDRDRLKQLTLNLVGNALQYTPEGGRVTLGLCRVDDWARLSVSDTGPGIPREELPRIFERFYRVDKSRRRTYSGGAGPRLLLSGAGLGLSIAHYIARAHHGRLEVASEVGQGSTFSVWLPLMSQVDAAATRPTPALRSRREAVATSAAQPAR